MFIYHDIALGSMYFLWIWKKLSISTINFYLYSLTQQITYVITCINKFRLGDEAPTKK